MTPSLVQFDKKRVGARPGLCGVDEAGRGCLAGPVTAAAVLVRASFYDSRMRARLAGAINDSKQLGPADRDELYDLIAHWRDKGLLHFAAADASVIEIGAHNILGATKLAMARAIKDVSEAAPADAGRLVATGHAGDPLFAGRTDDIAPVLIDGKPLKSFAWEHEALVGGDGRSLAIAMASIVAKVTRDRRLDALDRKYPAYGFALHKGYGTPEHVLALHRHGPCPEHRALFLRNILDGGADARAVAEDDQAEFGF